MRFPDNLNKKLGYLNGFKVYITSAGSQKKTMTNKKDMDGFCIAKKDRKVGEN